MLNRDLILKKVSKIDDKVFLAKLLDKAAKAEFTADFVCSDFLDPYQQSIAEKALANSQDFNYIFHGGYSGAERVVIVFCPNFMSLEDELPECLPFKVIEIKLNGRDVLTHRDYLGSLMGLGIKREKIGDILVSDDSCSIIVLSEMADFIKFNLTKVGNTRVEAEVLEIDELQKFEPKVKEIKGTVASLRLDSITSLGFGISRSKITEFIRSDKVSLNWEVTNSLTKQVKEGDTISVRGRGRVVLETVGHTTKKDRICVLLKKFI